MDSHTEPEIPDYSPDFLKAPEKKPEPVKEVAEGWMPALNKTQVAIFNDTARYVLAHGPRGTGKGIGCLHALIRHLYDNENALAMACALSIRVGQQGVLYDLESLVLPAWRDGNRYPDFLDGKPHPKAGELMDEGIGLIFTPSKMDPLTKDQIMWVANRHGGWSCVILVSLPYPQVIAARMKGPAPSLIYFDELGETPSDEYFKHFAAQLGRRRGMNKTPQQFYASCNPTGEGSWVYQKYFVDCVDEKTGLRNPQFSVHHVPLSENIDRLPPGYLDRLYEAYSDPYERQRLIDGKWVDRPSGDAIFKNYFSMELHVKGDYIKDMGLMPFPNLPIITGFDPGPANFCVSLMQRVVTKNNNTFWWIFDEVNLVGAFMPFRKVVPLLLKRFDYWDEQIKTKFKYYHVADEAAFNQVRPDGNMDCAEIEKYGQGRIKLHPCPKGAGSVAERVSILINALLAQEIYVSATCYHTVQMLLHLVSKKNKPGEYDSRAGLTPVRSRHLHPFDSLTYPMLYFTAHPGRIKAISRPDVVAQVYNAGRG